MTDPDTVIDDPEEEPGSAEDQSEGPDDRLDSPLLEEVAQALQNAVHAAGESLKDAAPDWESLVKEAQDRLKAGLLVLLTEHAQNVLDLISALSHDVQAHVRGEPA